MKLDVFTWLWHCNIDLPPVSMTFSKFIFYKINWETRLLNREPLGKTKTLSDLTQSTEGPMEVLFKFSQTIRFDVVLKRDPEHSTRNVLITMIVRNDLLNVDPTDSNTNDSLTTDETETDVVCKKKCACVSFEDLSPDRWNGTFFHS